MNSISKIPETSSHSMEAECKFRVESHVQTRQLLVNFSADFLGKEEQCDTYLRHPSRDFRLTGEALRIRETNGKHFITYKGPRIAGPIKIRPEIELPMATGTAEDWLTIWLNLGFSIALAVRKTRESYRLTHRSLDMTVALDHVESLGYFVEIERIVSGQAQIERAEQTIQELAVRLQLTEIEPRSYLGMLLAKTSKE